MLPALVIIGSARAGVALTTATAARAQHAAIINDIPENIKMI